VNESEYEVAGLVPLFAHKMNSFSNSVQSTILESARYSPYGV